MKNIRDAIVSEEWPAENLTECEKGKVYRMRRFWGEAQKVEVREEDFLNLPIEELDQKMAFIFGEDVIAEADAFVAKPKAGAREGAANLVAHPISDRAQDRPIQRQRSSMWWRTGCASKVWRGCRVAAVAGAVFLSSGVAAGWNTEQPSYYAAPEYEDAIVKIARMSKGNEIVLPTAASAFNEDVTEPVSEVAVNRNETGAVESAPLPRMRPAVPPSTVALRQIVEKPSVFGLVIENRVSPLVTQLAQVDHVNVVGSVVANDHKTWRFDAARGSVVYQVVSLRLTLRSTSVFAAAEQIGLSEEVANAIGDQLSNFDGLKTTKMQPGDTVQAAVRVAGKTAHVEGMTVWDSTGRRFLEDCSLSCRRVGSNGVTMAVNYTVQ